MPTSLSQKSFLISGMNLILSQYRNRKSAEQLFQVTPALHEPDLIQLDILNPRPVTLEDCPDVLYLVVVQLHLFDALHAVYG